MRNLASIINRWQAIFLLFTLALIAPSIARAEDETNSPEAKAYSDLLKRAKLAANNNKIAEAIGLWMQAWKIQQHWHLLCYIGAGHFVLQQPDKAATYLTRCLKLAPYPTTPEGAEHRRKEREMLEAALDHVASVVVTAPQGARITVDIEERGTAPLSEEVFLMPGEHRFIAELDGRTVTHTRTTQRREKLAVALVFPQEEKPKPAPSKPLETKPKPFTRDLPIASNSDTSPWLKRWVPSIALLGTSAALTGAGVWMRTEANTYADSAQELASAQNRLATSHNLNIAECAALTAQFHEARTNFRRSDNASLLLFGAAGVLGVAGLVYPWLPIHGKNTSLAISASGVLVRGKY